MSVCLSNLVHRLGVATGPLMVALSALVGFAPGSEKPVPTRPPALSADLVIQARMLRPEGEYYEATVPDTLNWHKGGFWTESTCSISDDGKDWKPEPTVYRMTFRANTLVDIQPRDQRKGSPLYERGYFRGGPAPMKTLRRFVARTLPQ
jgi:hypothetical protein